MKKMFINGFGRIGRTILRAWAGGYASELDIVGINDIAAPDLCAHLFAYDSVFGPYPGVVTLDGDVLIVDGKRIPMHRTADASTLDLTGVDLMLECTGKAKTRPSAGAGMRAGAHRVLISGPCDVADLTVVLEANDHLLGDQAVVSNASCTTNALAPVVKLLDDAWGLETGWMTTIHCYTGSQPTIDAPRDDMLRSRAAGLSMVPTTTSAQALLNQVLPDIAGRIEAAAVRVPTASVSAIDLTVTLRERATLRDVHDLIRAQSGTIGWTDKPLVSSDLRARPESLIVSLPETRVTAGGLVRIFGWYDNEWGFSCRMLDVARMMI
ncbi:type I glyceraldehyde-3-phosphate dehydrogenase [Yoonia sediminilitoris]|uniref:Glyceraldehyde 3-phosphate dehydrogenase n=1 Tax=Yoonia sediminilitoris TaxID=1286148 RepID=A0A2T6KN12_9RHOB|nr:glyceraldehyde 3-phosphate dehydrogenase NAD-binding domain-containing protein [Yoonia sediminilitoris]PUB17554.1 glyceraldehyde 3-phosphate dehydrogenase [Yoonia sediminilitoris]RCW97849.1 glyceraldehyde 3-phosphate dehydrogenase [Yoonia sediminilitoris]